MRKKDMQSMNRTMQLPKRSSKRANQMLKACALSMLGALAIFQSVAMGMDDDSTREAWRAARDQVQRALLDDAAGRWWNEESSSSLKLSAQVQTRYLYNTRSADPDGRITSGFEARRTKLKATGKLGDPRIRFVMVTAFSRSTGLAVTEDVYARFELADHWLLKVGKFRPSMMREQIISSKYQMASDRSLLNSAFGQSYNEGVSLMYRAQRVRASFSIMDARSTFVGDQVFDYTLRADFMLAGDRSQMSDFASFRDDEPATMLGFGVRYLDTNPTNPADPSSSTLAWSADLTAEFGGSSVFLAIMGTQVDDPGGPAAADLFGTLIQGGYFVNDKTELFARYTHGDDQAGKSLNLVEVGANYYLARHSAKITCDLGYSFEEVTTTWRSASLGWLTDTVGEEGQLVFRTQMQFLF